MEIRLGNLNDVKLLGRAVREIELKYTAGGDPIANLSIAVNRRWKDKATQEWKDSVSYFDVVIFGQSAERCAERIKKGSCLLVEGELRQREWEYNGKKRTAVEILSHRTQILDKSNGEVESKLLPEATTEPIPDSLPHTPPLTEEEQKALDDMPF